MEDRSVLIDTSVLIDYFRKKDIKKTIFYRMAAEYDFCISIITEFEFLVGFSDENLEFANKIIENIRILPIDTEITKEARKIYRQLKKINKLIPIADLLISATTIYHRIPLVTLNKKHFIHVEGIVIK